MLSPKDHILQSSQLATRLGPAGIGYLAGLIDGEGSITLLKKRNCRLQLTIGNTSPEMMEWLDNNVGHGRVHWSPSRRGPSGRICATWHSANWQAAVVLGAVYPLLVAKRAQASAALEARTTTAVDGIYRLVLAQYVSDLNKLRDFS